MWPPHASTTACVALMAEGTLNDSVSVVVHWPVPDVTFWLVYVNPRIDDPEGPNRSMVPGVCVPLKVPPAVPQPFSPAMSAAGIANVEADAAGLVCACVVASYAVPHCACSIWLGLAATRSEHGLLLF